MDGERQIVNFGKEDLYTKLEKVQRRHGQTGRKDLISNQVKLILSYLELKYSVILNHITRIVRSFLVLLVNY